MKRFQVFVSSTFKDLQEARAAVSRSLLESDCFPAIMEAFPAANMTAWNWIKKVISESDYYVLILAGMYGSEDFDGKSFTQKEFELARDLRKHILVFTHENLALLPSGCVEVDPDKRRKLDAFRKMAEGDFIRKAWRNPDHLAAVVLAALNNAIKLEPGVGRVRGDQAKTLEDAEKLIELQTALLTSKSEIMSLRAELAELRDRKSCPELHVEVVNYATRKPLPSEEKSVPVTMVQLKHSEIPDYSESRDGFRSIGNPTNKDFYRQATEYIDFKLRHKSVALKVWNTGSTAAINARVVIDLAKTSPMNCVLENDVPERPVPELNYLLATSHVVSMRAKKQRIDTIGETFEVVEEFGTVQPQATVYSDAEIYLAPGRSHRDGCTYQLNIQLFADNLPTPLSVEIDLPFDIKFRKFESFFDLLQEPLIGSQFL